ncbi:Germination-specific N-acetylmuramoyl-L-alanine amidase precursor [compost metagenome]
MNRNDDYALSEYNRHVAASRHLRDLSQRSKIANFLQPKIMVSLHVNWSKKPDVRGPLLIYQNQSESILFAKILQRTLNELYGTTEEPRLGQKYYLLKYAKCPTVIVEMGFISNTVDRKLLTDSRHQKKITDAVARAIEQYFKMIQPTIS